jgi:hypothetical protein
VIMDMIAGARLGLFVNLTQNHLIAIGPNDGEAASHAEVDEETFAARQLDQNILRTAGDGRNALARKAAGKIARQGKPQIGTIQPDLSDAAALHGPAEPLCDRLDLGKLRHGQRPQALNG